MDRGEGNECSKMSVESICTERRKGAKIFGLVVLERNKYRDFTVTI